MVFVAMVSGSDLVTIVSVYIAVNAFLAPRILQELDTAWLLTEAEMKARRDVKTIRDRAREMEETLFLLGVSFVLVLLCFLWFVAYLSGWSLEGWGFRFLSILQASYFGYYFLVRNLDAGRYIRHARAQAERLEKGERI